MPFWQSKSIKKMTPVHLLKQLERRGFHFRVVGDKLRVGPTPIPVDLDSLIQSNRDSLIALLREVCPSCRGPLSRAETDRYRYTECSQNPVHFFEAVNKRPGRMMGLFTDFAVGRCASCEAEGEVFNGTCEGCYDRAVNSRCC